MNELVHVKGCHGIHLFNRQLARFEWHVLQSMLVDFTYSELGGEENGRHGDTFRRAVT